MRLVRCALALTVLLAGLAVGLFGLGDATLAQGSPLVWGTVPSPNRGNLGSTLDAISSVSGSDIWAVGEYNPGVPPTATGRRTLAEHWNGQTWSIVPSPNATFSGVQASHLRGVDALASNNVWAVGYGESFSSLKSQTLIVRWNGASWTTVPSPNPGGANLPNQLYAIGGAAANDLWAVGAMGFPEGALTLHWNGTSWQAASNGCTTVLTGVVAISPSDVWAVGDATSCHYNGTTWTPVPIALPGGGNEVDDPLSAVSASSSTDVWAVGERVFNQGEYLSYSPLVEHWNGSSWTAMTVVPGEYLNGVEALASNDVYAVGSDGTYGVVGHWDGTAWTTVPSPRPGGGALQAVEAVSATNLWAVGWYSPLSGGSGQSTLIEQAPSTTQGTLIGATHVANATVSWFGPATGSVTTDLQGNYAAAGLLAGTYTVTATFTGCQPASATVTISAGTTVSQDLHLGCPP